MKNSLFVSVLAGFLFVSCQKEMKISRSDHSVTKELHDFSPVYIDKDKNGEVNFNQANRIGNTHWILTVDRELTLDDITPALQELTYRKFQKESNHEDTKEIYFVYSDTLNKQNAFVKLPFKEIFAERSPEIEPELTVKYIFDKVTNLDDFKQKYEQTRAIQEPYQWIDIDFSKEMSVEEFVNILIEFDKMNISDKVHENVFIY